MGLFFKNRLIFRAEKEMPDPEELKLRFRRRVLFLTALGAVCLLSIPVLRDQIPALEAHREARKFTQVLLESRLLAEKTRSPVALMLSHTTPQTWTRIIRASSNDCSTEAHAPLETLSFEPADWQIQAQSVSSNSLSPEAIHEICFHPRNAMYLNGKAVKQHIIRVNVRPQEDLTALRTDRTQKISLANEGTEIILEPSGS